jgi:subtilisin family serine protease
METKEYIISLVKDVDYDSFWSEMESPTSGLPHIPDRAVSIVNNRDFIDRLCHYALTNEEAGRVSNDPRVLDVEIPPEQRTDIFIVHSATQANVFTKPNTFGNNKVDSTGELVNWGLIRHTNTNNIYGTGLTTTQNYNYALDGTGVDVVITDSGLQVDHPEFTFLGNSTSRVQQIDWYTESGVSGTQNANHYRDYDGHGTHVAGIAAGKTYGWAKNAAIYSIKVSGLEGAGDSGTGISLSSFSDVLIGWHRAKTNGRPTIVNASWGYVSTYPGTINAINYRNSGNVSASSPDRTKGMNYFGLADDENGTTVSWTLNKYPYRVTSVDVALEAIVAAGIHVCVAAGNEGHKIDVPTGTDYNNYFVETAGGPKRYYHQGMSPYSNAAIIVGSINGYGTTSGATLEEKISFSNAGPGVDVYAAGYGIRSAVSNTNVYSSGFNTATSYYWNSSYKQVTIQGTSQASPQVAGIAALYVQAHPTATPAQVKNWIVSHADPVYMRTTGLDNDYQITYSQWGGSAGVAMAPLGVARVKTGATTWANVANVKVKTGATTWSNVRAIWTKTVNGWAQSF